MIRRIVVPTDFSALSRVGINYALAIARQCEAELIILHVLPSMGHSLMPVAVTRIMENVSETAEAELLSITEDLKPQYPKIRYDIVFYPSVEEAVQAYTELHAIDLIVMSSKGGTGLKKVLFGSNTLAVVNNCDTPILVVPEHTKISKPKELIYASDLKKLEQELRLLIPLAQILDASIDIIHLRSSNDPETIEPQSFVNDLIGHAKIDVKIMEVENIHEALIDHGIKSKVSLLVIFTKNMSFLEQIFEKSIARELAWDNRVPLLIIKKP
jgi:nucleotide-binding universal stress UspA family protein